MPRRPVRHRGQQGRRPAGAGARSLRVLDHQRQSRRRQLLQRRQGRGRRRQRAGSTSTAVRCRASTSTATRPGSTRSRCRNSRERRHPRPAARHGRALSARLARGALRPRRRGQVLPLPQGAARHELVPHARLGDADGVPRPGDHRRRARDVLQAGSRLGLRVDPVHHQRPHPRLARARHAQVGRERLHHPDVPPHGAGLPLRRLQVPARAELDHRRAPARDGHARGLHRLPAALGPDRVLGDGRRDQPERDGAGARAVPGAVPLRRRRDQRRRAEQVLRAAHARDPRCDLRADRAAPLPRDPARRHLAAVVAGRGRARPRRAGGLRQAVAAA